MRPQPVLPGARRPDVEVGEQTGALDEMLQRLAIMYNDEVEQTADNLATILEPILIVLMGAVVGGIVICLFCRCSTTSSWSTRPLLGLVHRGLPVGSECDRATDEPWRERH